MNTKGKLSVAFGATAALLLLAVQLGPATAGVNEKRDLPRVCTQRPQRAVEIATAKLIIEYNSTDEDLGVHGAFDPAPQFRGTT